MLRNVVRHEVGTPYSEAEAAQTRHVPLRNTRIFAGRARVQASANRCSHDALVTPLTRLCRNRNMCCGLLLPTPAADRVIGRIDRPGDKVPDRCEIADAARRYQH